MHTCDSNDQWTGAPTSRMLMMTVETRMCVPTRCYGYRSGRYLIRICGCEVGREGFTTGLVTGKKMIVQAINTLHR
ncbi:hypothetical protein K504DRAFT_25513, partial [Pleomassaria siparia CBS 279.74]